MEVIPHNCLLEYNPDTLQYLRELYGFDQQRMNESIDILEEWLKKQEHFVKKTFPRDYLERQIIHNKGSVEKSKTKLDKLCTMRTLLPEYFENLHEVQLNLTQDICDDYLMPKMTPDYCRIYVMKIRGSKYTAYNIDQHLKYFLLVTEYLQMYDYCNGLIFFADWTDGNAVDYGLTVNLSNFRKAMDIAFEGHSMRIAGMHLLTGSKTINAFVSLFKQVLSPKLANRIHIHKTMDTVYKFVPRDLLPLEYGGDGDPLHKLRGSITFFVEAKVGKLKRKIYESLRKKNVLVQQTTSYNNFSKYIKKKKSDSFYRENLLCAVDSEEFKNYRRTINEVRTDEALRPKDVFNEYMGMSGTFRNLSVD